MSLTVGVIGGMGPAAALDFCRRLLEATPARRDQDHLHVILDNKPGLPDRHAAIAGTGPSPGPELARMAAGLERAGAQVLVMPCNTAHAFADDIRRAVDIPLIDLIEATADAAALQAPPGSRVGVLAADGCLDAGLYQRALAARGLEALVPSADQRRRLMDVIGRVKAGDTGLTSRADARALAAELAAQGARLLIAACTEIPLVLGPNDVDVPLVDCTDILVRRTLEAAA